MVTIVLLLALSGAPQGVSVKLVPLEAKAGATAADALLVTRALEAELKAQGYAVVGAEAKAQALIAGRLERDAQRWTLHVTLVNVADKLEVDDTRLNVAAREELSKAGTEAAKTLAAAIRQTWGVRARIKLR
jgi:hypothetical protein